MEGGGEGGGGKKELLEGKGNRNRADPLIIESKCFFFLEFRRSESRRRPVRRRGPKSCYVLAMLYGLIMGDQNIFMLGFWLYGLIIRWRDTDQKMYTHGII